MPSTGRRVVAVVVVLALIAGAGCLSAERETTPTGPAEVDTKTGAPGELFYFTAEVKGQTYLCLVYERSQGSTEINTRGFAGMSCDPIESEA